MSQRAVFTEADLTALGSEHIAPADYTRLTELVYKTCGIRLNASKQVMVETRLRKRLKETGAATYRNYWKLLNQEDSHEELIRLIDAITTNKTDFFREPAHFDYLVRHVLPELGHRLQGKDRALRVWSAGCSTGKEAYTLAMVLKESQRAGVIEDFQILGTDICTDVLAKAKLAIYEPEDIKPIPEALRKRYLLKNTKTAARSSFRIVPELRSTVRFERLNFMDQRYVVETPFDIIFCRNVIIYFDRATQGQVIHKLVDCLRPKGYFFTGHSETLNGLATPLQSVSPTIYRKGPKG